jgi:DNA-directed RNA polymerase specialized sigma24 family protein
LQLTQHDQERAEDLLHDAFVQFTLSHPDLHSIRDPDNYLFVVLRNLHLSQMRRAARGAARELSIVEYDSAELGLWAVDPRDQMKIQDELRTVCHYACVRKRTAKAGSVLILRFFHGYYPEEVAQVLLITPAAVKERLRLARAEAKLYLSDPSRLNVIREDNTKERPHAEIGRLSDDLLQELRRTIFDARAGKCFTKKELHDLYSTEDETKLSTEAVAHLVSCSKCLDEVNRFLGLPPLAERFATDMIGKDTRKRGGPGASSGKTAGGMNTLTRYLRRAQQVYRHEPHELCVAVNGYLQGSHKISAEQNELRLVIDMAEPVGFVEVFSEQGVRLLLLNVEPLPTGPVQQETSVELSGGRTLDTSLSFVGAWPEVYVSYRGPDVRYALACRDLPNEVPGDQSSSALVVRDELKHIEHADKLKHIGHLLTGFFRDLRLKRSDSTILSRPTTATALLALLLIAAFTLVWKSRLSTPLVASDLLQRATQTEDAILARSDTAIHRALQIEERRASADGDVVDRVRVDVWQSSAKGVTARRLYDERGLLLGGEWLKDAETQGRGDAVSPGSRTVYLNHVLTKKSTGNDQSPISNWQSTIGNLQVWQLSPSSKEFSSVVQGGMALGTHASSPAVASLDQVRVEENANHYVLHFANSNPNQSLLSASLILSRGDLHAIEETILIRQGLETRTFRITETSYERRPLSTVAPAVFEPDPQLLSDTETGRHGDAATFPVSLLHRASASPVVATPELELDVIKQLDQVNALYGEQISLTRTAEGKLHVQGIVDTENRKSEVLQALAPVKSNTAVIIDIETVTEAVKRQKRERETSQTSAETRAVQVETKSAIPAEPELRTYFLKKGVAGDAVEGEIRRYTDRVVSRSRQARRHALALKQIAESFSPDDLRTLNSSARTQWRTLISQHARSILQELETLQRELSPPFPSVSSGDGSVGVLISSDSDIAIAAKRLFELTGTVNEAVGQSFSLDTAARRLAPIKSSDFSRTLRDALGLSAQLSK